MTNELATQAVKVAPPIAVSALNTAGMPLSEWIYILTAVYLVFQIIVIVPRAYSTLTGGKYGR